MATKAKSKAKAPELSPEELEHKRRIQRIRGIVASVYLGDVLLDVNDDLSQQDVPAEMIAEVMVTLGERPEGIWSKIEADRHRFQVGDLAYLSEAFSGT